MCCQLLMHQDNQRDTHTHKLKLNLRHRTFGAGSNFLLADPLCCQTMVTNVLLISNPFRGLRAGHLLWPSLSLSMFFVFSSPDLLLW